MALKYEEWENEINNSSYRVYIITGKNHWSNEFYSILKSKNSVVGRIITEINKDVLKTFRFKPLNAKKHLVLYELNRISKSQLELLIQYMKNPSQHTILILYIGDWQKKKMVLNNFKSLDRSNIIKYINLDFPSKAFIKEYIYGLIDMYKLKFDNVNSKEYLIDRLYYQDENIVSEIAMLSQLGKVINKDIINSYIDDNEKYNYNKLYYMIVKANRKKIPFKVLNNLQELGRKNSTIFINIRKHFELLLQAKYLYVKGILDSECDIEDRKKIYNNIGIEFKGQNIWEESEFNIRSLVKESENISMRSIINCIMILDKNIAENKYNEDSKYYKTFLELLYSRM